MGMQARQEREVDRAHATLVRLKDEEQKLLRAHYADAVSLETLGDEQERIRKARGQAKATLEDL